MLSRISHMSNLITELTQLILWINNQGWSPATSTNYSFRDANHPGRCHVSCSGLDKSKFTAKDFIHMDLDKNPMPGYESFKPSAETDIHLMLYRETDCNVVLHTHSKADTLLSRLKAADNKISIHSYELLKGLRGIDTHNATVTIPIFPNNQNIEALSSEMKPLVQRKEPALGLLIDSHGFYTWGRTLEEAKRHLEVFQFLFDCELTLALKHLS